MNAQIIVAVAATGITNMAVVVTLCLALLRGFRGLHDKIDSTSKELRKDNTALAKELRKDNAALAKELRKDNTALAKELRKATAENTVAIARVEGRMTLMETVLQAILRAVLPGAGNPAASPSADADADADAMEAEPERTGDEDGDGSWSSFPLDAALPPVAAEPVGRAEKIGYGAGHASA